MKRKFFLLFVLSAFGPLSAIGDVPTTPDVQASQIVQASQASPEPSIPPVRPMPDSESEARYCKVIHSALKTDSEVILFKNDSQKAMDSWHIALCSHCTADVKSSLKYSHKEKPYSVGYVLPKQVHDGDTVDEAGLSQYLDSVNLSGCYAQKTPTDAFGYMIDYSGTNKDCVRRATAIYFLNKFGLGYAAREELAAHVKDSSDDFQNACHQLAHEWGLYKTYVEMKWGFTHMGQQDTDGASADPRQATRSQAPSGSDATPPQSEPAVPGAGRGN
jgi:hypothetical protein